VCAGDWGSAPATVIFFPDFTLAGAEIESVLLWHSDEVASVFGAVMPANAITATATARMPMVPMVSVFLMVLPRRPADRAALMTPRRDGSDRRYSVALESGQFSGLKQSQRCVRVALV
jgi:hypothetical protein